MHCKRKKNLTMKSGVVTYLLHDDVMGWTDYVNKHCCGKADNL